MIHDRFLRVVGVFLALAATALRAHDPGISTMQGELRNDVLVLVTGFAPADAALFLPQAARKDGSWDQADFDAVRAELLARRDTAGRKAAYQALDTTLQRAAGFDTFGYNCGCCGRSVAFINDDGRCLAPACREAKK